MEARDSLAPASSKTMTKRRRLHRIIGRVAMVVRGGELQRFEMWRKGNRGAALGTRTGNRREDGGEVGGGR